MSKIKKYTDEPRFKAIKGYESEFKKQFALILKSAVTDMSKLMKRMVSLS